MNTLEIVKKVCRKIGYEPPTTLVDADPDSLLALEWVQDAWTEIQLYCQQWKFMVKPVERQLVQGQSTYSAESLNLDDLDYWLEILIFGPELLGDLTYKPADEMWELMTKTPRTGQPMYYNDDSGLTIYPEPERPYTIKGRYKQVVQLLERDTDVPACKAQFHNIIYHKALVIYSVSDNSPEDFQYGDSQFELYLNRLDTAACPQVGLKRDDPHETC